MVTTPPGPVGDKVRVKVLPFPSIPFLSDVETTVRMVRDEEPMVPVTVTVQPVHAGFVPPHNAGAGVAAVY